MTKKKEEKLSFSELNGKWRVDAGLACFWAHCIWPKTEKKSMKRYQQAFKANNDMNGKMRDECLKSPISFFTYIEICEI